MTRHNWSIGPQAQLTYNDLDGSVRIVSLQSYSTLSVMTFEDFKSFQFFIDTLQNFKNKYTEEFTAPIPVIFLKAFPETIIDDEDENCGT